MAREKASCCQVSIFTKRMKLGQVHTPAANALNGLPRKGLANTPVFMDELGKQRVTDDDPSGAGPRSSPMTFSSEACWRIGAPEFAR